MAILVNGVAVTLVAVVIAGFFWLRSEYDNVMFAPRESDTRFVREELAPVFGEAAGTIEVVRVDNDVSAFFFVMERREGLIDEALKRFGEQGWEIRVEPAAAVANPTQNLTAYRDEGGSRISIVTLRPLDEYRFYGACARYDSKTLWKRYEENEKYLE